MSLRDTQLMPCQILIGPCDIESCLYYYCITAEYSLCVAGILFVCLRDTAYYVSQLVFQEARIPAYHCHHAVTFIQISHGYVPTSYTTSRIHNHYTMYVALTILKYHAGATKMSHFSGHGCCHQIFHVFYT